MRGRMGGMPTDNRMSTGRLIFHVTAQLFFLGMSLWLCLGGGFHWRGLLAAVFCAAVAITSLRWTYQDYAARK